MGNVSAETFYQHILVGDLFWASGATAKPPQMHVNLAL